MTLDRLSRVSGLVTDGLTHDHQRATAQAEIARARQRDHVAHLAAEAEESTRRGEWTDAAEVVESLAIEMRRLMREPMPSHEADPATAADLVYLCSRGLHPRVWWDGEMREVSADWSFRVGDVDATIDRGEGVDPEHVSWTAAQEVWADVEPNR